MTSLIVDYNEVDNSLSSKIAPIAQEESSPLDMEQGTISIVTPNSVTENANGKTKATITLPSASRITNAARIKAPKYKEEVGILKYIRFARLQNINRDHPFIYMVEFKWKVRNVMEVGA
ncbi:hypothetical protein PV325_012908 [Microctonus aethiopoides]|nr:hypothetical protein PV325_012908 [Microctonus aethiopoides]KAK0095475.1 hypothetical protein PV326_008252 [Microctonus aethiopoides]